MWLPILWEETVSARSGLLPTIWDKIYIFRTNRAIPRSARAYCREDVRKDVARRNINKMTSKITSTSEVNTGSLSSFSNPNLRQGLFEHFFECSHKSEDDSSDSDVCSSIFFSHKSSREDSLDMSYEESHSGQDNLRNVSQRSDMGNQGIQNDSKKKETIFFAEIRLIVYAI